MLCSAVTIFLVILEVGFGVDRMLPCPAGRGKRATATPKVFLVISMVVRCGLALTFYLAWAGVKTGPYVRSFAGAKLARGESRGYVLERYFATTAAQFSTKVSSAFVKVPAK